jgi:hypothetical protein
MKNNKVETTQALCTLRDMLRQQAKEILKPAEELLAQAKSTHHDALIEARRLNKQADQVQSLITVECQAELDAKIKLEEDYSWKSHSQIKEQYNISDEG